MLTDLEAEMSKDYAILYLLVMIDHICRAFKRKQNLPDEERRELAETILSNQSCRTLTVSDCKLFANKLIAGEIGSGRGNSEYEMYEISQASIFRKLKSYISIRNDTISANQSTISKPTKKQTLTEWQLTHDYAGNEMPPEWDAFKYWNSPPSSKELNEVILPSVMRKLVMFQKNISET